MSSATSGSSRNGCTKEATKKDRISVFALSRIRPLMMTSLITRDPSRHAVSVPNRWKADILIPHPQYVQPIQIRMTLMCVFIMPVNKCNQMTYGM